MSTIPTAPIARWRLKSGQDRRFKAGHPWVFSNELQESPQGIELGQEIELCSPGGEFLARGYGNPNSLIAFRAVTRNAEEKTPLSQGGFDRALASAWELRRSLGYDKFSSRLCYGEADSLPGLIVDRYVLGTAQQVQGEYLVVQAHTAGMDCRLDLITQALQKLFPLAGIIIRNDVSVREKEGLTQQDPRVLRTAEGYANVEVLKKAPLRLKNKFTSHSTHNALIMHADLLEGQKTGFFLDQAKNIELMSSLALEYFSNSKKSQPLKILDLCCYIGQWGVQLGVALKTRGFDVQVTFFDASAQALEQAAHNASTYELGCKTIKGDVLTDLEKLPEHGFDIVISDPPALIKNRKSIPQGQHAYLQLNTQAIRLTRPSGLIASCSCSSLLDQIEFEKILAKAARRNHATVQWLSSGGHSPDHPVLLEFPEGHYLKAWMGISSQNA